MDFDRFSPNFTDRFFRKPTRSEGADFLVSSSLLNTALASAPPNAGDYSLVKSQKLHS
jgi:hypothetical protein